MSQLSRTLKCVMSPRGGAMAMGVIGIIGCSSAVDVGGNAPAQLSFTTSSNTVSNAAAALAPITNGGHTLDLTHVTLTLARAELKRATTDGCREDQGDEDHGGTATTMEDCPEVRIDTTSVDLPLAGGLVTLPANAIPAGTFRELELRVSTVRLQGTFDTKPFDVTLPINTRGEIQFTTPLVVTEGTPTAITVNVPVNTWLVNSDGSLVDPSAIATNSSLLGTIRSRIAASFRAFEDENHDGNDDHDHSGHGD